MIRSCWVAALLILAIVAAPASAQGQPKKSAFLVGINQYYDKNIPVLKFAENDVRKLADVLRPQGYDVTVLAGPEATKENIHAGLDKFVKGRTPADTILIGFAGHGWQIDKDPNQTFFMPVDAVPSRDPKVREKTLFAIKDLSEKLQTCHATKVVLIDACRDDPDAAVSRGVTMASAGLFREAQTNVVFSCSQGERAYEIGKYKQGLFFYHVVRCLRGDERDAVDSEGRIDLNRLAAVVARKVVEEAPVLTTLPDGSRGAKQTPNQSLNSEGVPPVLAVFAPPPSRDVTLTKPKDDTKLTLKLSAANSGETVAMIVRLVRPPAGGTYLMGDPEAGPEKRPELSPVRVHLAEPFFLGETAVTRKQYACFPAARLSGVADDKPMVGLSWEESKAYCDWLSAQNPGKRCRLPYEHEREWAARGQTAAVVQARTVAGTLQPVDRTAPNEYGLHQMCGNVWEWCGGGFTKTLALYAQLDATTRDGATSAKGGRAARGGHFSLLSRRPEQTQPYSRKDFYSPADIIGFRVLVEAP